MEEVAYKQEGQQKAKDSLAAYGSKKFEPKIIEAYRESKKRHSKTITKDEEIQNVNILIGEINHGKGKILTLLAMF